MRLEGIKAIWKGLFEARAVLEPLKKTAEEVEALKLGADAFRSDVSKADEAMEALKLKLTNSKEGDGPPDKSDLERITLLLKAATDGSAEAGKLVAGEKDRKARVEKAKDFLKARATELKSVKSMLDYAGPLGVDIAPLKLAGGKAEKLWMTINSLVKGDQEPSKEQMEELGKAVTAAEVLSKKAAEGGVKEDQRRQKAAMEATAGKELELSDVLAALPINWAADTSGALYLARADVLAHLGIDYLPGDAEGEVDALIVAHGNEFGQAPGEYLIVGLTAAASGFVQGHANNNTKASNVTKALNKIVANPTGGPSGHSTGGLPINHASSGKVGAAGGCTVLYVYHEEHAGIRIVAVAHHLETEGKPRYAVDWQADGTGLENTIGF